MMDSFVEAQNNLKRTSYAGASLCKSAAKPRSSLLVHADGHEVTGLKTYRGPKRKEQLGVCSLPGFYVPEVVGREFCLGAPDCSVVISDTLAKLGVEVSTGVKVEKVDEQGVVEGQLPFGVLEV